MNDSKNSLFSFSRFLIKSSHIKKTIVRALNFVYVLTPELTIVNTLIILIIGVLPLINLYLIRIIINTVTQGIIALDKTVLLNHLIILLIAAALLALFTVFWRAIASYCADAQSIALTDKISDTIHTQSIKLDLTYYDNIEYQNTLHLAQTECIYRPRRILISTLRIGQNGLSIVAIGLLLFSFSFISGIIIFCSAIPAVFVRFWASQKLYDLRLSHIEIERKNWYYHKVLTSENWAKEIRLFSLGRFFMDRYREIQISYQESLLSLYRFRGLGDMISQGFITIAMFGSFTFISIMTVEGKITTGDMVMYFVGFQLCISYVEVILDNLGSLYEDQLFLHHLFHFLDLQPNQIIPMSPIAVPVSMRQRIEFKDVSFSYPGEEKPVLSKVNLILNKGEIIAIVGNNGAGKSTLINLLCRLYDPDNGKITMDGIDISQFDPEEWRQKITVIFQDFVRYQLSSAENIWISNLNHQNEEDNVKRAARKAHVDNLICRLPKGYDTILGKYFSYGHELSGGEWQKIALARGFFRDAEIIILDEPTSSLDVYTEAEIIQSFQEIAKGHSVLLISHRLSTVKMADMIYVLDEGTISECGTHSELIRKNGQYAKMFAIQVAQYL